MEKMGCVDHVRISSQNDILMYALQTLSVAKGGQISYASIKASHLYSEGSWFESRLRN